jgi:hypothetical protein
VSRLSRQCGILNISQPYRPPRPGTRIASLHLYVQRGPKYLYFKRLSTGITKQVICVECSVIFFQQMALVIWMPEPPSPMAGQSEKMAVERCVCIWPFSTVTISKCQRQNCVTTAGQSASLSWCEALSNIDVTVSCGAVCDEGRVCPTSAQSFPVPSPPGLDHILHFQIQGSLNL